MRPDLFAHPALRDDHHRILSRLANGGNLPAPDRQWGRLNEIHRARIAAVAALLATIAATWVWLQDEKMPPAAPFVAAVHAEQPVMSADAAPPQAAAIVNEAPHASPVAPPPTVASTRVEPRAPRARAAKPAAVQRGPSSAPATEYDEDVTLLTAMLKHANPQQPSATPPKDR